MSQIKTKFIADNQVTNAKLRQSPALSVVGNAGSTLANVNDISGTADQVLRVNSAGTALAFGQLNLASSSAVTGALTVTNGGTGLSSATAYAVICGGTTSTGAFQSVSGVGTSGQVLTSNGASALPTWQNAPGSGLTVTTVTVNTSMVSNRVYLVNKASAATMTLPAPSSGAYVYVKDISGAASVNQITVNPNASETIDGASSYVMTFDYGYAEFVSDGTNWFVTDHNNPTTPWTGYTPGSQGFGTPSFTQCNWRRVGDSMQLQMIFTAGTVTNVEARINLPTLHSATPTIANILTTTTAQFVGNATRNSSATNVVKNFSVLGVGGNGYVMFSGITENFAINSLGPGTGTALFGNGDVISFFATIPITNWKVT